MRKWLSDIFNTYFFTPRLRNYRVFEFEFDVSLTTSKPWVGHAARPKTAMQLNGQHRIVVQATRVSRKDYTIQIDNLNWPISRLGTACSWECIVFFSTFRSHTAWWVLHNVLPVCEGNRLPLKYWKWPVHWPDLHPTKLWEHHWSNNVTQKRFQKCHSDFY